MRSIISYTTSIVTLDESLGCIYFGVCVSDMDAVCHISELRPEALQLNCCGCVHNLDENPVYIAKEVYFVSPLPPSCCVKYVLQRPGRYVLTHGPGYPRMHLKPQSQMSEHLVLLSNNAYFIKASRVVNDVFING